MRAIIILGGLIMLLYFRDSAMTWTLIVNQNNILSEDVVNILHKVPPVVYKILYYAILMVCILSMFPIRSKLLRAFAYILALVTLHIGLRIGLDQLAFQDYTEYAFVRVYHPIPIESRFEYFTLQIDTLLKHNKPEIFYNPEHMLFARIKLDVICKDTIWSNFAHMSPSEIKELARHIVTRIDQTKPLITPGRGPEALVFGALFGTVFVWIIFQNNFT